MGKGTLFEAATHGSRQYHFTDPEEVQPFDPVVTMRFSTVGFTYGYSGYSPSGEPGNGQTSSSLIGRTSGLPLCQLEKTRGNITRRIGEVAKEKRRETAKSSPRQLICPTWVLPWVAKIKRRADLSYVRSHRSSPPPSLARSVHYFLRTGSCVDRSHIHIGASAGWRRAQLRASTCYISAGHAHPKTPYCAGTAAIPDQQRLLPRRAF
jgi:hypothetical protein